MKNYKWLLIGLSLWLAGCASKAVLDDSSELSFIKTSTSSGGGMYGLFTGDTAYCMLETLRVDGYLAVVMVLTDGECQLKVELDQEQTNE